MKIFKLVVIIFLALFISCSYAENRNEDKIILKIIIPLDNKADDETFHITIQYHLRESGFAYDMRSIYGWAMQASRSKQLNEKELVEVITLAVILPEKMYEGDKDKSLTLELFSGKEKIILTYKQNSLPVELDRIFRLLGGLRFELQNKLKFDL